MYTYYLLSKNISTQILMNETQMSHCPQPISDEGTKKGKFNEDKLTAQARSFQNPCRLLRHWNSQL